MTHPYQPDHEKTPLPSDAVTNPRIWSGVWLKSISTSVAPSSLGAPRRTGLYRISVYLQTTAGGSGNTHAIQFRLTFVDSVKNAWGPLIIAQINNAAPAVNSAYGIYVFEAKAGYPINYDVFITSVLGAPVAHVRAALEEIR